MGVSSLQASVNGLDNFSQLAYAASNSFGIMEVPTPTRNLLLQQQRWPPLQCPRCNSTNTKFCYFNNYSKSQPRYLCKSCRRHWTEGGTLRDVPVGGGRKNKRNKAATTNQSTSDSAITSNSSDMINNNSNSAVQRLLNGNQNSSLFPEILRHVLLQPAHQGFPLPSQPPTQTAMPDFGMMTSITGQREIICNNFGSYPNGLNNTFSTSGYTQTGTEGDISTVPPTQLGSVNWSTWENSIFELADPDVKPPTSEGC